MDTSTQEQIVSQNIPPVQVAPQTPEKKHTLKKFLIALGIIIIFAIGLTVLYFSAKKLSTQKPATIEDKLNILNNLDSNPPNDGSVRMTDEEKLSVLKKLNSASSKTTGKATLEEQNKILNSVQ